MQCTPGLTLRGKAHAMKFESVFAPMAAPPDSYVFQYVFSLCHAFLLCTEEQPVSLLCSYRLGLAIMAFLCFVHNYAQRIGMSVAVVCMVNHTALDAMENPAINSFNASNPNATDLHYRQAQDDEANICLLNKGNVSVNPEVIILMYAWLAQCPRSICKVMHRKQVESNMKRPMKFQMGGAWWGGGHSKGSRCWGKCISRWSVTCFSIVISCDVKQGTPYQPIRLH